MDYILLIIGFVLLIKGADFFVDGSSSIARLFKVPSVVIGLTIVAMGTSAPEAAVSITAGLEGSNAIAISNILGSNMFNTLVVVGVCGAMAAFAVSDDIIRRDMPVNIAISAALLIMIADGKLSRLDGFILFTAMVIYMTVIVLSALKDRKNSTEEPQKLSLPLSLFYIVIGIAAIIGGGQLVVDSATNIAYALGWSETFVGLTIVAVGTSLPELVTSIVATRKGERGLALGNAIGSNIFNILFILGVSSMLSPIAVEAVSVIDAGILAMVAVVIYLFAKNKQEISRAEGIVMVLGYVAYTIYLLIR